MYTNARFRSTGITSDFVQNYVNDKISEKINIKNPKKHILMYSSTKFQSIWRKSDFETKFAQKNITDKNFEKINIKTVISIYQCTPLRNFSQFEEIQIMGPNMPKKHE